MSPTIARWVLAGVLGLAAAEWAASAVAYRDQLDDSDWAAAAEALAPVGATAEPVFVADRWLDPLARSNLPILSRIESIAPASLHGARRFHVLGFGGSLWSEELQADLENLGVPRAVQQRRLGDLMLTTYELDTDRMLHDFTRDTPRVLAEGAPCGGRGPFRCKQGRFGRVETKLVEIDYRPRSCFEVDMADGVEATLEFPGVAQADVLRGHVGFTDYNGRLRSDAPAVVTLERSGQRLARWVVTDEQGWQPLTVEVTPSEDPVIVRIRTATQGRWERDGYTTAKSRPACFELQAFTREGP